MESNKEIQTIEYTEEQLAKINSFQEQFLKDTQDVSTVLKDYFEKYNSIICAVNTRHLFNQWSISFTHYGQALRDAAIKLQE